MQVRYVFSSVSLSCFTDASHVTVIKCPGKAPPTHFCICHWQYQPPVLCTNIAQLASFSGVLYTG